MAALGLAGPPVVAYVPLAAVAGASAQPARISAAPAASSQPQPLDPAALTVKLSTLAGERFKDMFYHVFDTQRSEVWRFFAPGCLVVWEGSPGLGQDQCKPFFENLPSSKHAIETFDVQPVTGGELRGVVSGLLVTVTGTVSWGIGGSISAASSGASDSSAQGFYHSFHLERSPTPSPNTGRHVHQILSASMRTRHLESASDGGAAANGPRTRKRPFGRSH